ncbi:MAG TPA: tetratricopeptide repeat protein [Thermodesulfobacteriota bacterium]|nr:tetratricopeptide repeat protein [Thermodesulfobacteriota bacterium]
MEKRSVIVINKRTFYVRGFLVSGITFLVYLSTLEAGFVNWDDQLYVLENTVIQSPDSFFLNMAFTVVARNWHPLTLFSHAIDYSLWGFIPFGHHLTNISIHALNSFLVFILTSRLAKISMPGSPLGINQNGFIISVVTALLFGIHPLHVESVAWISERKNVLYAFFFILSILSYLRYATAAKGYKKTFYGASLFFFALSLMSKSMAITLPLVLLILDYHPIRRLTSARWLNTVLEKAPFFALSFSLGLVTLWTQRPASAIPLFPEAPLLMRIGIAIRAYAFYLYKMVAPINLAPFYPYPGEIDFFTIEYSGSLLLIIAITAFCILYRKWNRAILAAWLYYMATLLPVIGIIPFSSASAADRYTYLPSLGPFLVFGAGIGFLFERHRGRKTLIIALSAMSFLLVERTLHQIAVWKNPLSLWSHELKLFPDEKMSYYGRGHAYYGLGRFKEALDDLAKAIEIDPYDVRLYTCRGNIHGDSGGREQAINDFKKAISLNPRYAQAYYDLGSVYLNSGETEKAISNFKKAEELGLKEAKDYLSNLM